MGRQDPITRDLRPGHGAGEDRRGVGIPTPSQDARRSTYSHGPRPDLRDWIDAIIGGVLWAVFTILVVIIFGVLA